MRSYVDFIKAIENNEEIEPNFYDGMKTMQILEAGLQSAAQGKQVELGIEDWRYFIYTWCRYFQGGVIRMAELTFVKIAKRNKGLYVALASLLIAAIVINFATGVTSSN